MPKIGRPTKYKPGYAKALTDYFNQPVLKPVTETVRCKSWVKQSTRYEALFFPTFQGFAASIGVSDNTLENWSKAKYPEDYAVVGLRRTHKYPNFLCAYTRARNIQKGLLLKYAMIGRLNSGFAQFLAINNCGMKSRKTVAKIEFLDQYARTRACRNRDFSTPIRRIMVYK